MNLAGSETPASADRVSTWRIHSAAGSFDLGGVAGNTQPFAGFVFHPGIGPALVAVDAGTVTIDTFAGPRACCNRRIAVDAYFHVANPVVFPLTALQVRQQFFLVVGVAVHVGGDESF